MLGTDIRVVGVLVIGVHDDGKDHLGTVCGRGRLVQSKSDAAFAGNGFAVNWCAVCRAVANQEVHVGVVGIAAIGIERHRYLLGAALHFQRNVVGAGPTRSDILIRNKIFTTCSYSLVRGHLPSITVVSVIPVILFPISVAPEILV